MTLWLLLLAGWGVAGTTVALVLDRQERRELSRSGGALGTGARWVRGSIHLLFWPLFAPLTGASQTPPSERAAAVPGALAAAWEGRIREAERQMREALGALGSGEGEALSVVGARVDSLGTALRRTASRLGELEGYLAQPAQSSAALESELAALSARPGSAVRLKAVRERLDHLVKLASLRERLREELEAALASAAELATRLSLLRYEGRTASDGTLGNLSGLLGAIDELCSALGEVQAQTH